MATTDKKPARAPLSAALDALLVAAGAVEEALRQEPPDPQPAVADDHWKFARRAVASALAGVDDEFGRFVDRFERARGVP